MLGPKFDENGRAGQALAAPSPARSGVVLIVRKTLAVPANRARLTRAGLLLLSHDPSSAGAPPPSCGTPSGAMEDDGAEHPEAAAWGVPTGLTRIGVTTSSVAIVRVGTNQFQMRKPRRGRASAGSSSGKGRRDGVGARRTELGRH